MAKPAKSVPGKMVRYCRENRGITICDLEAASGVTAVQISNIEHGRSDPKMSTLLMLLDAMDFYIEVIDNQEA